MKKHVSALVALTAASALLLSGCSGASGGESRGEGGDAPKWEMQGALPDNHWWAQMHRVFADALAEGGSAAPQVAVTAGGALGIPNADVLEYIADGRAEIIEAVFTYTAGTFPEGALFDQQMLMPTFEAATEAWELLREDIDAELQERFNAKVLYGGPSDAQIIFSSDPVKTLDDLSGKVFRAPAQAQINLISGIPGASATPIASADAYSALERGVIDGVMSSTANTLANSWDEVTKYALNVPTYFSLIVVVVNLDTYDALSDEARAEVEAAAEVAQEAWYERGVSVSEDARGELEDRGVTFEEPSDEVLADLRAIAEPQWEAWASSVGPTAEEWLARLRDAGYPDAR